MGRQQGIQGCPFGLVTGLTGPTVLQQHGQHIEALLQADECINNLSLQEE